VSERVLLSVQKGALVPADDYARDLLRERGYHTGDVLSADLRKPRNPAFHRLVHVFGQMCADNIEDFGGLDCHTVLKRIQLEANIGCSEIALNFPGIGPCSYRIPKSLSFASMDDGEFYGVFRGMCRHVSKSYWGALSEEQIAEMADTMVNEAA